jgi:hypothetical protein
MTTESRTRPPLSKPAWVILGLHGVAALVFVVVALIQSNDPGWATLQRIVALFMFALWGGGIVLMGVIARYVISSGWGRLVLLLAGPFIGLAFLIGSQYVG